MLLGSQRGIKRNTVAVAQAAQQPKQLIAGELLQKRLCGLLGKRCCACLFFSIAVHGTPLSTKLCSLTAHAVRPLATKYPSAVTAAT
jgi:hypothetical protein